MNEKILTVYAPASSGNVSVGFDALGLALAPVDGSLLGDCVSVVAGEPGRLDAVHRRAVRTRITAGPGTEYRHYIVPPFRAGRTCRRVPKSAL